MPWLSISNACKELGVSRRSIWRKIEDGTLQSKKNEEGLRFVYIDKGEKNNAVFEPHSKPYRTEANKSGEPLFSLIESIFYLISCIKKKVKESVSLYRILSNIPCGANLEREVSILKEILNSLEVGYEKIQYDPSKENLKLLFFKMLDVKEVIMTLLEASLSELEAKENYSEDGEMQNMIKGKKIEIEKVTNLFDEIFLNLKRLLDPN